MITTDKRFIGEIEGFSFPNGILNKKIAGAGATEFAIRNDEPTVILSPRLGLIESKVNQHPELLEVKSGVTVEDIRAFTGNKIISTYDSFYKIKEALDLTNYRIFCDEMQFVVKDSAFKSGTIRKMLKDLKDLPKVTYVSATPLHNIFKNISYFKDTPYEEIEWTNNSYKEKLNLIEAKNPLLEAAKLCQAYANGVYQEDSDSIVLFVNSINGICNIIKKAGLTRENTNVLIAETDNNKAKLSRVKFKKGFLPNRGEEYKPITLCTSAYAAGADFYNEAAVLYIVSDVYVTKPFSIADEIPQIAGRLRLGCKSLNLIYKAGNPGKVSIADKRVRTSKLIKEYEQASELIREKTIQDLEKIYRIAGPSEDDFLIYNEETGQFEEDELAISADIYNEEIIKTYKNGIILARGLEKDFDTTKSTLQSEDTITVVKDNNGFETAIKDYINGNVFEQSSAIIRYPQISVYMSQITPEQARALSYREERIKRFIANNTNMKDIKLAVLKEFTSNIPVKQAKAKLAEIYKEHSITRPAKTTDIVALLPDYFEIKSIKENGKVNKQLIRKK